MTNSPVPVSALELPRADTKLRVSHIETEIFLGRTAVEGTAGLLCRVLGGRLRGTTLIVCGVLLQCPCLLQIVAAGQREDRTCSRCGHDPRGAQACQGDPLLWSPAELAGPRHRPDHSTGDQ